MKSATRAALAVLSLLALATAAYTPQAPAAEKTSLDPPVLLPDGSEFKTWEQPPEFSETFHVDQAAANASDDNPGTQAKPWRSITHAAQVLRPGQRVVVKAGVYRERVRPVRGGTGPRAMIAYEAAPGEEVVLKGSVVLETPWKPCDEAGVWTSTMPADLFDEQNPFAAVNLTDEQIDRCMPWAVPIKGHRAFRLRRGLVFQDGRRLAQALTADELSATSGAYRVGDDGLALYVRPFDNRDPNLAMMEVTVRGFVFAPEEFGLGYVRVQGFTIEHSAACFPRPQQGALSTQRGHHWIIQGNTVRQCNAIGVDIGDQFDAQGPACAQGGQHIVRGNTITDCGIGGLEGKSIEHTLIESNTIRRCGWQNVLRIYETGGIKVHCTRSCLIRRNLVTDTVQAPGIWMDYANINSRLTANLVINADSPNGAIFMEASQRPNLVDRNIVWGSSGHGIYQHDCDQLVIAHNLVVDSRQAGVCMRICQGRIVGGRPVTAKRNRILGNVLVNAAPMLSVSDPENESDYNVFAPGPNRPFDLAAWQTAREWDEHTRTVIVGLSLDPERLLLTWSSVASWPEVPRIEAITHDFLGRPLSSNTAVAGPFGQPPREPTSLDIDPR